MGATRFGTSLPRMVGWAATRSSAHTRGGRSSATIASSAASAAAAESSRGGAKANAQSTGSRKRSYSPRETPLSRHSA